MVKEKRKTINSQSVLELMQKFDAMDSHTLKLNMYKKCKPFYKVYGGRPQLAEYLGFHPDTFYTMINVSHINKITFVNFIIICGKLGIDYDTILTDTIADPYVRKKNARYRWTDENKKEYIKYFLDNPLDKVRETFKLSARTADYYFTKFQQDLKEQA